MSRLNSLKQTIFTVVVLAMVAGCAPLKISKPNMWPFTSEDPPGTPTRIVASWTDTVLYQPNQVPMRGFGGRVLFYSGEKPEPIKVEGTLTVYIFDETNRDPNNVKPDRKYVFTKDQLPSHYSKSKLGNSYSVWLPWDETGGPQKDVSLIARFTPEKGSVVVGEQTKQILPGKPQIIAKNPGGGTPPAAQPQATPAQYPSPQNSAVQPASNVTPLPPVNTKMQSNQQNLLQSPGITTTTIPLPPQSSLKNSLLMGNVPNPIMSNQSIAPPAASNQAIEIPAVDPRYVTKTGVINPAAPSMAANPPARYPAETMAFNPGFTAANQAYQPVSPPNRFAPGRLPAPNAPTSLPNRDLGPWPQPPSAPQFVPDTTPQPTMTNGYPQSSLKAGLIPN
jgi:hypothetical protein